MKEILTFVFNSLAIAVVYWHAYVRGYKSAHRDCNEIVRLGETRPIWDYAVNTSGISVLFTAVALILILKEIVQPFVFWLFL